MENVLKTFRDLQLTNSLTAALDAFLSPWLCKLVVSTTIISLDYEKELSTKNLYLVNSIQFYKKLQNRLGSVGFLK